MDSSVLDYNLPHERIARFPAQKRDLSRLLVYERKSGKITHAIFKDLPDILPHNFDFFRNDAAVLKGRIFAQKPSGGNVECLLLTPCSNEFEWTCMLKPGKRLPVGSTFGVKDIFEACVVEKHDDGMAIVRFETFNNMSVIDVSEKIGVVPLPPYIERKQNAPDYDRKFDNERYQTVYADPSKRVAAAAPTAGLHFTKELVEELKSRGNKFHNLTLHVGIGTFQPLKSDSIEAHKMHSEVYEIPTQTLEALTKSKLGKLAVGTTSLRAMEDFSRKNLINPRDISRSVADAASLFVYPPQKIISTDAIITNFHLPRSTLMCLIAAFLTPDSDEGISILKQIYAVAIEKEYNFYSYGDAMLIL